MTLDVMLIVLLSALLHAGWNALVRSAADKFAGTLAVVLGAGALAAPLLVWLPLPAAASWPYVLASGLIHVVYFSLVAWSYRHAELSLAYPLMRGTAPALAAVRPLWRTAALGGGGTLAAYALVLWAMGHAPIATVAALRESSIVFAALLGALFLRERISRARLAAIALVCAGAACIKLF